MASLLETINGPADLRKLPRARSLSARQGLGNLTRPGSQAAAVMVSLGLGVAVIAQIQLAQSGLLARVADDAPADAPNFFFVGILPDQVEPFRALLAAQGALEGHCLVPIVQARLARVGGREVADMKFASESEERSVTREFAITWQDELPPGNEVVAGAWWTPEAAQREAWVSAEQSLAQRLELEVGEEVVFDIQGVRVPTRLESVRAVDWGQLQTNFMFILTKQALTGAPTSWAATARSRPGPEGRRALQAAVIAAMPNVTAIDAAEVIERALRRPPNSAPSTLPPTLISSDRLDDDASSSSWRARCSASATVSRRRSMRSSSRARSLSASATNTRSRPGAKPRASRCSSGGAVRTKSARMPAQRRASVRMC